jgi:hypothetical protein
MKTLDKKLLHSDILIQLSKENKSKIKAPVKLTTLHRLSKGELVKIKDLFKCISWLKKDINDYIN